MIHYHDFLADLFRYAANGRGNLSHPHLPTALSRLPEDCFHLAHLPAALLSTHMARYSEHAAFLVDFLHLLMQSPVTTILRKKRMDASVAAAIPKGKQTLGSAKAESVSADNAAERPPSNA